MNAALPLLLLLVLAAGGGGGEPEELETSKYPKKKKITPPPVTGPGGTAIDGNSLIEKSDWYHGVIDDFKHYRKEVEDVDGMVMAASTVFRISPQALVAYHSIKKLSHLLFPDEGEDRLDILGEAVAAGIFDQIFHGFGGDKK